MLASKARFEHHRVLFTPGARRRSAPKSPGWCCSSPRPPPPLALGSAWLLAAGYLGHCLWDLVHHRRGIDTAMPWWWVPACLGYDAVIGAYILLRLLSAIAR
jgi:hypothetical protein